MGPITSPCYFTVTGCHDLDTHLHPFLMCACTASVTESHETRIYSSPKYNLQCLRLYVQLWLNKELVIGGVSVVRMVCGAILREDSGSGLE